MFLVTGISMLNIPSLKRVAKLNFLLLGREFGKSQTKARLLKPGFMVTTISYYRLDHYHLYHLQRQVGLLQTQHNYHSWHIST